MKVKVNNLSSGLIALPAPLSVTLAAGRGATLSLSEPEWKAACSSPSIARLIQTRLLSMGAVQEAPPAPKPVVVSAPAIEEPKAPEPPAPAPEPAPEPVVEAPAAEPALEVAPAPEPAPVAEPAPEAPAAEPAVVEEPAPVAEPAPAPEAQAADVKKKKKKT
jgi:hypothetical protein